VYNPLELYFKFNFMEGKITPTKYNPSDQSNKYVEVAVVRIEGIVGNLRPFLITIMQRLIERHNISRGELYPPDLGGGQEYHPGGPSF
jgi:hypothetical protein